MNVDFSVDQGGRSRKAFQVGHDKDAIWPWTSDDAQSTCIPSLVAKRPVVRKL